jgi:biotin carboxyl carrier protein
MTPGEENIPLRVPKLNLDGIHCLLGTWLVRRGQNVVAGDRVVEIWAGDLVVDLSAPVSGVLVTKVLNENQPVEADQIVGWIRPSSA